MAGVSKTFLSVSVLDEQKTVQTKNEGQSVEGQALSTFRYQYQRYRFDAWKFFTVSAINQIEADKIARIKFLDMINSGHTVCKTCYLVP